MRKLAVAATLFAAIPVIAAQDGAPIRAHLTGYQEVPAVSTLAEGFFEARIAPDNLSFDFTLSYEGLQADAIMSHIHFAQKSVNGPIVVWLCDSPTNVSPTPVSPCPLRAGTVSGTVTAASVLAANAAQQLTAGEIAELIAGMRASVAYVNVHTTASPSGEIRGQLSARGHSGR